MAHKKFWVKDPVFLFPCPNFSNVQFFDIQNFEHIQKFEHKDRGEKTEIGFKSHFNFSIKWHKI